MHPVGLLIHTLQYDARCIQGQIEKANTFKLRNSNGLYTKVIIMKNNNNNISLIRNITSSRAVFHSCCRDTHNIPAAGSRDMRHYCIICDVAGAFNGILEHITTLHLSFPLSARYSFSPHSYEILSLYSRNTRQI